MSFWTFTISTALLIIISLFSTALYYWNIHAYLLLFPLLPLALFKQNLNRISVERLSHTKLVFNGANLFGLLFMALFVWNSSMFPISALFSQDSDQDARMIYGWKEVVVEVQKVIHTLPEIPLIITSDYRSASALAYEMDNPNLTAVSQRISQFTIWNLQNMATQKGKNAILVFDRWYPLNDKAIAHFDRVTPISKVPISRFGVLLKTYEIAIGQNYKP